VLAETFLPRRAPEMPWGGGSSLLSIPENVERIGYESFFIID